MKLFSLFTGAGGLDYGFEAAGFKTALAIEMDSEACATLRMNRPSWPLIQEDIHRISPSRALQESSLGTRDVDVIIGGPPCQPFSKSGYWARGDSKRLADPRANTLESFLQYVENLRPAVFVLENVHGICYNGKDEGLKLLLDRVEAINRVHGTNYIPKISILNAADYGVPQVRKRFFMVASKDGQEFIFPNPTHMDPRKRKQGQIEKKIYDHMLAWDAIGDLNDEPPTSDLKINSKWAEVLPSIPEGHNYLYHTIKGEGRDIFGYRTKYWSYLLKLAKNRPSWTIQATPARECGPFHWKNRRLSVREMARLQTIPDDISFAGGFGSVQRQIGNAVPSLLAEVIAREIGVQFFGARRRRPRLAIEPRRPVPEAEPVEGLPYQFLKWEGKFSRHPGEGYGPKGRMRRSAE